MPPGLPTPRCGPKRACARSRWVNDASMLRCDGACGQGDQAPRVCCTVKPKPGSGRRGSRRDGDLITQAREAFVAAEDRHHIEQPRRGRAAGESGPQGLRDLAELDACRLGAARTAASVLSAVHSGSASSFGERPARCARPAAGQDRRRALSSSARGRSAKRNAAPSSSSTSVLARSFRPGMAASELRAVAASSVGRDRRAAGRCAAGSSRSRREQLRHRSTARM